MAKVMIGDIYIGSIIQNTLDKDEWIAYRESADGSVRVGTAKSKQAALTLLGRSIFAKLVEGTGMLGPTQRQKVAEVNTQLRGLGLGEVADAIEEALKS